MVQFAVSRPISVLMIGLAILVLGTISVFKIPLELMPEIKSQEFQIVVYQRGASAEEIEKQITTPLERAISTTPGLLKSASVSQKDTATISLSFRREISLTETISLLKDRVESVAMPEGATKPKVTRMQSNQSPVMRIAVRKNQSLLSNVNATQILENTLIKDIERIKGVATAQLMGGVQRGIQIEIDSLKLLAFQLTIANLIEAIQNENKFFNAGEIVYEGLRTPVKIGNEITSIDQLQKVIVKKDGVKTIGLGDIAKIKTTQLEPAQSVQVDGQSAFLIEVRKESEANTVDVTKAITQAVDDFSSNNDSQFESFILFNQGEEIERAIKNVSDSVRDGALLAGIAIFLLVQILFPTFVIVIAIPLSLLLTFIMMHFSGMSFNLMSLAGLALGVGMLVDNSTVVLDSISLESLKFSDPIEAALKGTKKVGVAITFSTLSTIAVFAPLAFVPGTIGQIFKDVSMTVCFSIFSSLIVSILFIPCLSARQAKLSKKRSGMWQDFSSVIHFTENQLLELGNSNLSMKRLICFWNIWVAKQQFTFKYLTSLYRHLLKCISLPVRRLQKLILPILFNAVNSGYVKLEGKIKEGIEFFFRFPRLGLSLFFGSIFVGFGFLSLVGSEMFPEDPSDQLTYHIEFRPGATDPMIGQKMKTISESLTTLPFVQRVTSVQGLQPGIDHQYLVQLKGMSDSNQMLQVNSVFEKTPEIIFERKKLVLVSSAKPVRIEIFSEDPDKLKHATQRTLDLVKSIEGLIDIETSAKPSLNEVTIRFSKSKLALYDIDPMQFITPMRSLLKDSNAGLVQIAGESLSLSLPSMASFFSSIDQIRYFFINSADQRRVYLSQVATVEERNLPGVVHHYGKKRFSFVQADVAQGDKASKNAEIAKKLAPILKDSDVKWQLGGQDAEQKENTRNLIIAIGVSVLIIYLLLAAQYENLLQPIVVLSAVPLCLLGVGAFLIFFQLNLSAIVFVGFIILVGSSVNTSIIMVDFANQIALSGEDLKTSIVRATQKRMKPILITTLSNLFGLVPMAMAAGEKGSALQQPLAVTILGGHISSTILTLLTVPLIYVYLTKREARS